MDRYVLLKFPLSMIGRRSETKIDEFRAIRLDRDESLAFTVDFDFQTPH
jgi:hypothetical protein